MTFTRILLRRDSTSNWASVGGSVILGAGEPGIEIRPDHTTGLKIGNGVSVWNELDYINDPAPLNAHVDGNGTEVHGLGTVSVLNAGVGAGEVPQLDANGQLLPSVMPHLAIVHVVPVTSFAERNSLTITQVQKGDIALVEGDPTPGNDGAWILVDDQAINNNASWLRLSFPAATFDNIVGTARIDQLPTASVITNDSTTVPLTSAVLAKIEEVVVGGAVSDISAFTNSVTSQAIAGAASRTGQGHINQLFGNIAWLNANKERRVLHWVQPLVRQWRGTRPSRQCRQA